MRKGLAWKRAQAQPVPLPLQPLHPAREPVQGLGHELRLAQAGRCPERICLCGGHQDPVVPPLAVHQALQEGPQVQDRVGQPIHTARREQGLKALFQPLLVPGPLQGPIQGLGLEQGLFVRVDHTEPAVQADLEEGLADQAFAEGVDRADVRGRQEEQLIGQVQVRRIRIDPALDLPVYAGPHLFGCSLREGHNHDVPHTGA